MIAAARPGGAALSISLFQPAIRIGVRFTAAAIRYQAEDAVESELTNWEMAFLPDLFSTLGLRELKTEVSFDSLPDSPIGRRRHE